MAKNIRMKAREEDQWVELNPITTDVNVFSQGVELSTFLDKAESGKRPEWSIWDEFDKREINVKWYGATGDGVTDDTQSIIDAIADGRNRKVFFPKGDYKVSGNIDIDQPTKLVGDGATLVGDEKTLDGTFINVDESLYISGITFKNLPRAIDFSDITGSVNNVTITDCVFIDCGRPMSWTYGTVGDVGSVHFTNNHVEDCISGVHLWTESLQSAIFTGNTILEVGGRAIAVGKNKLDIDVSRVIVSGNNISGVRVLQDDKDAEQEAILVYGEMAVINGNIITDVQSQYDGGEAIYTKCRYSVISNNVIKDIGNGGGTIIVKGTLRGKSDDAPLGYGVRVDGNIIANVHKGISIHNEECVISNNYIDGVEDVAIETLNDNMNNLTITNNKIRDVKGRHGIRSRAWGRNISITDNVVDRVTGTNSTSEYVAGIEVDANETGVNPRNYVISRNLISDVRRNNGIGIRLGVRKSDMHTVNICQNVVSDVSFRGIDITGDQGLELKYLFLHLNQVTSTPTDVVMTDNLSYPNSDTDQE